MVEYKLDYLLQLAYDFYYNSSSTRDINIIDIELSDAENISNIKITPDENKIKYYINDIFNSSIIFLNKIYEDYIFIRKSNYNSLIKIRKYNDNINNNYKINFLLSDFCTKKLTRHIIIPILCIDIPSEYLIPFFKNFVNIDNLINNNNILSISIYENFFKMMTLKEFFNKNKDITKNDVLILIFQIIHTLAIIRNKYKNFSHNSLDIDNIYVYCTEKNNHTTIYKYNNKVYYIPNNGLVSKISNFISSDLNENNNSDIKTFFESLFNLNNKIINSIKNNIILYINMKAEEIMSESKFMNNFEFSDEKYNGNKHLEITGSRYIHSLKHHKGGGKNSDSESDSETISDKKNKKSSKKLSKRSSKKSSKKLSKKLSKKSSKKSSKKNKKLSKKNKRISLDNKTYEDHHKMYSFMNNNQGMPGMSGMPNMMGMPGMQQGMPNMMGMPGMQQGMPDMSQGMSGMSGMPGMPQGMSGMPGMPGMSGMPGMPQGMPQGMPGMQQGEEYIGGMSDTQPNINENFDQNQQISNVQQNNNPQQNQEQSGSGFFF